MLVVRLVGSRTVTVTVTVIVLVVRLVASRTVTVLVVRLVGRWDPTGALLRRVGL